MGLISFCLVIEATALWGDVSGCLVMAESFFNDDDGVGLFRWSVLSYILVTITEGNAKVLDVICQSLNNFTEIGFRCFAAAECMPYLLKSPARITQEHSAVLSHGTCRFIPKTNFAFSSMTAHDITKKQETSYQVVKGYHLKVAHTCSGVMLN